MHPLDPIAAALATAALLLLPGWLVLLATGVQRWLDVLLVPAAALTVSLALLAPALIVVLAIGASIWWCVGWVVGCAIVAAAFAWRRRSRLTIVGRTRRVTLVGLLTVGVALGGSLLALWTGGDLRRDQVYHTARVVKLVELDAPTFASASRIEDGGTTTPYAFPLWHGAQAMAVTVGRVDPMLLAWLLPSLLVPLSILTFAGLGRVVLGSTEAGLAAAVAWGLLRIVDYAPDYRYLTSAQWPGMVAATIVVPLICALVFPAVHARSRRARWSALALGAVATLVVIGIHGNYVLFPALLVAGTLAWLVVWDRAVRPRRALELCVVWGGAAAAGVLAMLPVLREHGGRVGDGSVDALVRGSRNADYFERVDGGWSLLLEPLAGPPLTILAIGAAILLVFLAPRSRGAALAAAGLAAVVAVARVPLFTEAILGLGNLTAVTRLWLAVAVPATIAAAAALLFLERSLRHPRTWRILTGVAMLGLGSWFAIRAGGAMLQAARELLVPALLATVTLGLVVGLIHRTGWGGSVSEAPAPASARSVPFGRRELAAAGAVLVLALVTVGFVFDGRYERAVHRDSRLGEAVDSRAQLREVLRPGDVVLADEQDAYVLPAVAPVHVVGDYKWWLERSARTDTVERLQDVRAFFDPATTPAARARILERRDVDAIVVRAERGELAPRDARRTGPWLVARRR